MEKMAVGNDVNQIKITSLNRIQGQPDVVKVLQTSLEAYFNQRATAKPENPPQFGSVLFTGPPGVGKSLVAKALHCELGNLNLVETNGELINNVIEASSILMNATPDTTIFIDEATMSMKTQNVLLTAISERKLYIPKSGNRKSSYTIPLPPFVLILCTNFEHEICDALRNRMRICCRFNYYSIEDLTTILKTYVNSLGWKCADENILRIIALRSKQTPRLALNRNLQMVWNVCVSHNRDMMTLADAEEAFRLLGIDELGLDCLERQYLKALLGGANKLNVLSSRLALPPLTISSIERYLLRQELIDKNGCNRMITEKGKQHLLNTTYQ
jgi:Holliday junction DNA helicase RuvB